MFIYALIIFYKLNIYISLNLYNIYFFRLNFMGVHIMGKNQKNKKEVLLGTIHKGEILHVSQRN